MVPALFGIDVAGLLEDLIRGLLDLLVPDFASDWGTQLVSWLAALPPSGLRVGGTMYMFGNRNAGRLLFGIVVGLGLVLLAPSFVA